MLKINIWENTKLLSLFFLNCNCDVLMASRSVRSGVGQPLAEVPLLT